MTNLAPEHVLDSFYMRDWRTDVQLVHYEAGLQLAGSGTTPRPEAWGVRYERFNAVHGQRYKTLAEAKEHFTRLRIHNQQQD